MKIYFQTEFKKNEEDQESSLQLLSNDDKRFFTTKIHLPIATYNELKMTAQLEVQKEDGLKLVSYCDFQINNINEESWKNYPMKLTQKILYKDQIQV